MQTPQHNCIFFWVLGGFLVWNAKDYMCARCNSSTKTFVEVTILPLEVLFFIFFILKVVSFSEFKYLSLNYKLNTNCMKQKQQLRFHID